MGNFKPVAELALLAASAYATGGATVAAQGASTLAATEGGSFIANFAAQEAAKKAAIATLFSAGKMGLSMAGPSQQNAAIAQQRADIQQRQYQLQIQERDKRARLKRAQATQRARFGGQGLNSTGGSAAALLEGLRKDTEKSIFDQRSFENMQVNQLAENTRRKGRINLLENRNSQISKGLESAFNLLER